MALFGGNKASKAKQAAADNWSAGAHAVSSGRPIHCEQDNGNCDGQMYQTFGDKSWVCTVSDHKEK